MRSGVQRSPIERMAFVCRLLREREPFNATRLAILFEVSTKTIQRDLDFMRDRLGYQFEWKMVGSLDEWSYVGKPPRRRVL